MGFALCLKYYHLCNEERVPGSYLLRARNLDGLLEFGDGFVVLPLFLEHVAPVVVSSRVFRIELDGLLVFGDGFVVLPLFLEHEAPVVVSWRGFRIELEGVLV